MISPHGERVRMTTDKTDQDSHAALTEGDAERAIVPETTIRLTEPIPPLLPAVAAIEPRLCSTCMHYQPEAPLGGHCTDTPPNPMAHRGCGPSFGCIFHHVDPSAPPPSDGKMEKSMKEIVRVPTTRESSDALPHASITEGRTLREQINVKVQIACQDADDSQYQEALVIGGALEALRIAKVRIALHSYLAYCTPESVIDELLTQIDPAPDAAAATTTNEISRATPTEPRTVADPRAGHGAGSVAKAALQDAIHAYGVACHPDGPNVIEAGVRVDDAIDALIAAVRAETKDQKELVARSDQPQQSISGPDPRAGDRAGSETGESE